MLIMSYLLNVFSSEIDLFSLLFLLSYLCCDKNSCHIIVDI